MLKIKKGEIDDLKVSKKLYASIEHGDLKTVNALVLHRTDSLNAQSVFDAYKNGKKSGAHFLIDKKGKIYQTARLNKRCWHVGILLPKCLQENSCDPKELKNINAILYEKGASFSSRAKKLSRYENKKNYPLRYPGNDDSIGVEVVGKFLPASKKFEVATSSQLKSIKWLTKALLKHYSIKLFKNVYAHGAIARKEAAEGAQLLQYLFNGATQ